MKKIKKSEVIFSKHYDGMHADVFVRDLPTNLLGDDIIQIHRVEPYYSENNSWDEHTVLEVIRSREETDAEFEERKAEALQDAEERKKIRYENYLKLKKEFENGPNN